MSNDGVIVFVTQNFCDFKRVNANDFAAIDTSVVNHTFCKLISIFIKNSNDIAFLKFTFYIQNTNR